MGKVKIFIVEDSKVVRHGLIALLNQIEDFEVIGEADDGAIALSAVLTNPPDLAIVDIGLPGIDGTQVTRQIKDALPATKTLMFTSHDDDADMFESFTAGADGYFLKQNLHKDRLELAIRTILNGHCWIDRAVVQRILNFAKHTWREAPPQVRQSAEELTQEEESALTQAECSNGVCMVSPDFLARLNRFKHCKPSPSTN